MRKKWSANSKRRVVRHLEGDLFAELSAGLAAHDINRRPPRDLVKPCGEDGIPLQPGSVAREVSKDRLGNVLCQMG